MGLLRFVLALSVVMSHGLTTLFGFRLFDGGGAVWTFFAISGFLITIALSRKYDGLRHFYWNRIIRLYPSYWAWLAITLVAYLFLPSDLLTYQRVVVAESWQASGFWIDHFSMSNSVTLAIVAFSNFTGLFVDAFLQMGLDPITGSLTPDPARQASIWAMGFIFLGQFWSIGVELCFYAVAPFVIKSLPRIAVVFFLSASGVFKTAWVAAATALHLHPTLILVKAPEFLWTFMIGAALAHAYMNMYPVFKPRSGWQPATLLIAMYAYLAWQGSSLFQIGAFPWWLFAILTGSLPWLFHTTAQNTLDRFAGDLSYPIYINHFLIIQFFGSIWPPHGYIFAGASIAVAALMVIYIDNPAKNFKFQISRVNLL